MKMFLPALCLLATTLPSTHAAPDKWQPAGAMSATRHAATATLLPTGHVLVAGGLSYDDNSGFSTLASADLYTPGPAGTWAPTGVMNQGRQSHTATPLPDGRVLVAAGIADAGAVLASTEIYDPDTKQWTLTNGALGEGRYLQAATTLAGDPAQTGGVLVTGGLSVSGALLKAAEIYNPGTGLWGGASPMAQGRYLHTATPLADGKVLIAGGLGVGGALASAEIYDPATKQWSTVAPMAQARQSHTATLLANGKVLVVGGLGMGGALASAEIYDPAANNGQGAWSTVAPMAQARRSHTATLLQTGQVLIAGGIITVNGSPNILASAELFDPTAYNGQGAWSTRPSLAEARYGHVATLLADGTVLVAGGSSAGAGTELPIASAERYIPETVTPTPGTAARPVVAITGKKKLTTTKASVKVKGTATGTVTAVQVKAGKKTVKAKGTTSWSAKVKVKPGRNKITAIATGPGGTSAPAKATILRR